MNLGSVRKEPLGGPVDVPTKLVHLYLKYGLGKIRIGRLA